MKKSLIMCAPFRNDYNTQSVGFEKLTYVISELSEDHLVIAGNFNSPARKLAVPVITYDQKSIIWDLARVLLAQVTHSLALIVNYRSLKNYRLYLFRPIPLILPTIVAKLLGMEVYVILTGFSEEVWKLVKSKLNPILQVVKNINLKLANRIIIYDKSLLKHWGLLEDSEKVLVGNYLYVDLKKFQAMTVYPYGFVGYIGRFSKEKGFTQFAKTADLMNGTPFYAVGGNWFWENMPLNLSVHDWVPNDKIPEVLNSLKVLVIPSYTEGLPNILLEALACGVPVLSSAKGLVSKIISESPKTVGWLVPDNEPKTLARKLKEDILNLDNDTYNQISINCRDLVEEKFSRKAVLESYRDIVCT